MKRKKLTYNQKIETSREIRQWVKGIFISVAGITLLVDGMYPDLKYKIKDRFDKTVKSVKSHFSKKEES